MKRRTFLTRHAAVAAGSLFLVGAVASAVQAQDAKQLYEKNCVSCHGASGKADGPAGKMLKPPPIDFAVALKGKSDADINKVTKEGGKATGKGATMPAYGAKLSDAQIQALTDYMKSLVK
jgi:mono/diheme cytochrome c family protein